MKLMIVFVSAVIVSAATSDAPKLRINRITAFVKPLDDPVFGLIDVHMIATVNTGTKSLLLGTRPVILTGADVRDQSGKWVPLQRSSWYDTGQINWGRCTRVAPHHTFLLGTIDATVTVRKTTDLSAPLILRFYFDDLCSVSGQQRYESLISEPVQVLVTR
ncbi:MAG TPA: hypothetical protein VFA04_26190 [Bryobacteraceae bacterium]|nr:hypothetical protein [Bryobacteraceae bacterium]